MQISLIQIRTFAECLIRSDAECSIQKHSCDPKYYKLIPISTLKSGLRFNEANQMRIIAYKKVATCKYFEK